MEKFNHGQAGRVSTTEQKLCRFTLSMIWYTTILHRELCSALVRSDKERDVSRKSFQFGRSGEYVDRGSAGGKRAHRQKETTLSHASTFEMVNVFPVTSRKPKQGQEVTINIE